MIFKCTAEPGQDTTIKEILAGKGYRRITNNRYIDSKDKDTGTVLLAINTEEKEYEFLSRQDFDRVIEHGDITVDEIKIHL